MLRGAAAGSSSSLRARDMCFFFFFFFATDYTACYHDDKQKFPFTHFTQVLFNTDTTPPPTPPRLSLPAPSKLRATSLLPASPGVRGILFD